MGCWRFGGNVEPVREMCESDWRECPSAVIRYVWSEVVTDVVECLSDEWIVWRTVATLLVGAILVRCVYSKSRLIRETRLCRNDLSAVGRKVQDLELRVNILTYKMQYGTWPLPRRGLVGSRNVRLRLTDRVEDRDRAWLRHMLLGPWCKEEAPSYGGSEARSVRCLTRLTNLETRYVSSKYRREEEEEDASPRETSRVSSSGEGKSSGEAEGRAVGSGRARSECPESWLTRGTPEERVSMSQETLGRVRSRLENLHSVLRIYGAAPSSQRLVADSPSKTEECEESAAPTDDSTNQVVPEDPKNKEEEEENIPENSPMVAPADQECPSTSEREEEREEREGEREISSDTDSRAGLVGEPMTRSRMASSTTGMELEEAEEARSESEEASWPRSKSFPLDIISEEQSAGSSTEKTRGGGARESVVAHRASKLDEEENEESREEEEGEEEERWGKKVRDIREYIEVYSRMQKRAIVAAKRAISDESARMEEGAEENARDNELDEIRSIDEPTRHLEDTESEPLPRESSEPATTRFLEPPVDDDDDDDDSPGTSDLELKRRPGAISLLDSFNRPSSVESSRDEYEKLNFEEQDVEDKEEEDEEDEDKSRTMESPMTGRTVVRADDASRDSNETLDLVVDKEPSSDLLEEGSSVYLTDRASLVESIAVDRDDDDVNEDEEDEENEDREPEEATSQDVPEEEKVEDDVSKRESTDRTNSGQAVLARGSSASARQRVPWSSSWSSWTSTMRSAESRSVKKERSLPIKGVATERTERPGENSRRSSSVGRKKLERSSGKASENETRRSRSYATPRKTEKSRNSDTRTNERENSRLSLQRRKIDKEENEDEEKRMERNRSTCQLWKNASKSSIPVLRKRLEGVLGTAREKSQEKRTGSPMRCPLTIPSSRVATTLQRMDDGLGDAADTTPGEKPSETRTVIYVNIVTEEERGSATRIVDPKKFLEYLKDRELKIEGVHPGGARESSPRILTVVSSAGDRDGTPTTENSWSMRVEKREIQVTARPSVMDTSTSVSDLPEDGFPSPPDDSSASSTTATKFHIFQVPKQLTKDEYIRLLEALNRDPNLGELQRMGKLCDKLGLGFND